MAKPIGLTTVAKDVKVKKQRDLSKNKDVVSSGVSILKNGHCSTKFYYCGSDKYKFVAAYFPLKHNGFLQ